jgi:ParB family chromosome partitioning protein
MSSLAEVALVKNIDHIAAPLRSLAVRVDSLHADPSNARKHGEKNHQSIKASLARFGQRKPIVVQSSGRIVRAGNGTLAAARDLGWQYIAATIIDEGHTSATAYAIADNRTAELAAWDDDILGATLQSLAADEVDLGELGFDGEDLASIIDDLDASEGLTDADDANIEDYEPQYKIVVLCRDEQHQGETLARLESEGLTCQLLML